MKHLRNSRIIYFAFAASLLAGACRTSRESLLTDPDDLSERRAPVSLLPADTLPGGHPASISGASKPGTPDTRDYYEKAYEEIRGMLEGWQPLHFKRAVFVTENAYLKDSLDYREFSETITSLTNICRRISESNPLENYTYPDSIRLSRNAAIFQLLTDTIYLIPRVPLTLPPTYRFNDFSGRTNWQHQFVTELLKTGTGNCHSLPYLYKILANELHAEAYLSLAPNHLYLKHRSKWLGWYNTELTSGQFPTDAWVKASGYITIEAIRSGIYMDTLSQAQSVALCLYDLAKGYEMQTGNFSDGFILKCCDLVLTHHSVNVQAMILKAETLRKNYDLLTAAGKTAAAEKTFSDMQELYVHIVQLGYREMPREMYEAWLQSAREGSEKFTHPEINRIFHPSTTTK